MVRACRTWLIRRLSRGSLSTGKSTNAGARVLGWDCFLHEWLSGWLRNCCSRFPAFLEGLSCLSLGAGLAFCTVGAAFGLSAGWGLFFPTLSRPLVAAGILKSSLARIDKRMARAERNTRYRYNKISPLDHKMADDCVSLARTNTLSSTITKPIKTWKTSNKSCSYNILNRINKMYTHDLFYLQEWLLPVYKQIRTTKSQLTQCTKY